MTKKVIITSKNPVKIEAVRLAFAKMFAGQEFEFEGVSVESGVTDQPMSDAETFQGALNRVSNAEKEFQADFYVGLEGGLQLVNEEMEAFAWMVIKSGDKIGKSRTSTFFLPEAVIKLIKEGYELGEADNIVFKQENSKQKNGSVGILTHDVVTRTSFYVEALCLALIPFKNPELYNS